MSVFDSPDECYFNSISQELRPKRDKLVKLLQDAGLEPVVPEGGYFMLADISKIAQNFSTDETEAKDSKFVKYLIREKVRSTHFNFKFCSFLNKDLSLIHYITHETNLQLNQGLATIPVTAFYSDGHKHLAENYIRFCFFKV